MKRITILILSLALILSCITITAFANTDTNAYKYIEELPDGSYYEITITELDHSSLLLRATQTKSGEKAVTYKSSSGKTLWSVKVIGEFTYTGTSSKCTSSTVSASSNNSLWKISNKSASKSGNTASATATAKLYQGTSVLKTISRTTTLTCSAKGVLS